MDRKAKLTWTKEIVAQQIKNMLEPSTFGKNLILKWKRRTLKMEEMVEAPKVGRGRRNG